MRTIAPNSSLRLLLAFLVGMACFVNCIAAHGEGTTGLREYEIKAAFLYNFAKFTDWPEERFADKSAPFVIGVLGEDPFGQNLDKVVEGKSINGHPLVVSRFRTDRQMVPCHLLFISPSERRRIESILSSFRGQPTLTVSETDKFCQQGGIINFRTENNKVKFEINPAAAERCGLKLSSKLLTLARLVKDDQ